MALPLPPKASCTPADAPTVRRLLDSVIAYRPAARTTYQFYEEVDTWLGPWGRTGYPIGYGKKYNILFTANPPLNRDLRGRSWVRNTSVYLQEAVRDYLVRRVRAGTIRTLTERELRGAAFNAHARAYLRGGLLGVVENSPELFLVILTIPIDEFNPSSPDFHRTVRQVIEVISTPRLMSLLRTALGAGVRSTPQAILLRCLWQQAARRIPGIPPLPAGAVDDNFWDRLGLLGGVANIFDR